RQEVDERVRQSLNHMLAKPGRVSGIKPVQPEIQFQAALSQGKFRLLFLRRQLWGVVALQSNQPSQIHAPAESVFGPAVLYGLGTSLIAEGLKATLARAIARLRR
ncbi:MAG TPA: hypothetical protein VHA53_06060, partial [Nitrolancea sp.]|nr:hypothetical protein [Nitrolancea sp.]